MTWSLFIDDERRFGDTSDAYSYILEELQGHSIDTIYESDE